MFPLTVTENITGTYADILKVLQTEIIGTVIPYDENGIRTSKTVILFLLLYNI